MPAKKIGREYIITLAAIKDMLNYDRSRLDGVPWDKVIDRCPVGAELVRDEDLTAWIALQAEARGLRRLQADVKKLRPVEEDEEEWKEMRKRVRKRGDRWRK